jgi:hypothetical protein
MRPTVAMCPSGPAGHGGRESLVAAKLNGLVNGDMGKPNVRLAAEAAIRSNRDRL